MILLWVNYNNDQLGEVVLQSLGFHDTNNSIALAVKWLSDWSRWLANANAIENGQDCISHTMPSQGNNASGNPTNDNSRRNINTAWKLNINMPLLFMSSAGLQE